MVIADVRPSPLAGQWYPASPMALSRMVDEFLDQAQAALPPLKGEVVGLAAPHAGYIYSGPVAAYAFAAVRGQAYDLVAVVSPMHYPARGPLLTTGHQAYGTPLGTIPVDEGAVSALGRLLREQYGLALHRIWEDQEHALEIELPFLQRALAKPFRLVPVMVRDQSRAVAEGLGHALAEVLRGRNALLVASTDLSHYYPQPVAEALDREMLRRVEAFDPEGVLRAEEEGKGFACGKGALAAVMWAARDLGATKAQVLRYATSGDTSGDYTAVVGYGAAAFLR